MRTLRHFEPARWLALGMTLLVLSALSLSAHAVGSLADIRIHDRTAGRQLPVYWHEGRAYVVGQPGNEYEVVIRNRAGDDLLAVVSVDGVNAVTGETASPDQGGYVVRPRQATRVGGWRKSLDETAAFYFTSLGDSYAGRTGRPDDVGVIGVALFERARYSGRKSDSVAPGAKSHAAPSAPLGTGHGRLEDAPARWAEFERASRAPVETVAIYYDSYRNLVAQGVIPRNYGRRDPRPFPGFVPDPVDWRR